MSIMQSFPDCLKFRGLSFFVSLKVCLFRDEIRAIREPRNNALQVTSAMPDKSFRRKKKTSEFIQSQISITADNRIIHDLSCAPRALWIRPLRLHSLFKHQFTTTSVWTSCPPDLPLLFLLYSWERHSTRCPWVFIRAERPSWRAAETGPCSWSSNTVKGVL